MKKVLLIAFAFIMFACKSDKKKSQKEEDSYIIPSTEESGSQSPLQESMARGKELYSGLCSTCHLPTGQGIPGTYPPLDGSNWLTEKREASIHAVKFGLRGEITVNGKTYDNLMPPLGLSDQEVADALNYAMNSWSNNIEDMITAEEVAAVKE
ncbi:c-type cytochrome [Autumnicola psychrophila]|uniref:Cytochrome c n=1 Tax=Autumnicola psychrophila TaxID=3075592 RepID=A0ABU3DUQ5_9FLAO|nr:cytochrome c [Zunongwangia sp. F225]MDT0687439.1 cytochrome c [Zunongwangia sp. F225]